MKKPTLNVRAIKIRMIEMDDLKPGKLAEKMGMSRALFSYTLIQRSPKRAAEFAEILGFDDPIDLIVFE